jgi:hypothetical protein
MPKFRKKPVVIEAVQFFSRTAGPLPDGVQRRTMSMVLHREDAGYYCKTLNGLVRIEDGEWIITGVAGEFYPCKPDIFEQTYELVAE